MIRKLKDLGILPEKLEKNWDGKFKLGFMKALDLLGEKEIEALKCPECDGQGWYVLQVRRDEQEQIQCEYCNCEGIIIRAVK